MPRSSSFRILSLDTSTLRGSVALLDNYDLVAELRLFSEGTHSARLLNSVETLTSIVGWDLKDLNLISVGIGPGSFTGIRIGVATALGFASSLSIPLAGISGLDASAFQLAYLDGCLGVLMDAQRHQVYYAEYNVKDGRVRTRRKARLLFLSDLDAHLGRSRIYLTGDGAYCYARELRISRTGSRRFVSGDLFLAAAIGRRARNRKNKWSSGDSLKADPLYIRPPDAVRMTKGKR